MKGVIFNIIEDVVVTEHGADTWDRLLERTGLSGAYTALGHYDDDQIRMLVAAAASELETDEYSVLSWLGRHAFRELATRYEDLVAGYRSTRALLGDLDTVIHREVERLYPEAHTPRFAIEESDGQLLVHYASDRGLVAFAIGMIHGAADHFGEEFTIERVDDGTDSTTACLCLTPVAAERSSDARRPAA